jgi:hypothetical protein
MTTALDQVLMRSAELDVELLPYLELPIAPASDRLRAVRGMCGVAFEHAESIKMLIATGNFTSALGLLRLQYEAMLRGFWLHYAAPESAVSKLMGEFTREAVGNSEKLPMQADMIKALEGKAPPPAMVSLNNFKEQQWKPLSSFVHGGIHALTRHSKGYPVTLLTQVVCVSNGLSTMAAMLLLIISSDRTKVGHLTVVQADFADCLPGRDLGAL